MKINNKSAIAGIVLAALVAFPIAASAAVPPTTGQDELSAGTIPPTTTQDELSAGNLPPTTPLINSSAGAPVPPTTVEEEVSAGGTIPPTTEIDSSAGATVETSNTTSGGGTTNSGGTTSSGSVATGGSSGGSSSAGSAATFVAQCPYLTTYMKIGGNNSTAEVTKLQSFLRNTEGFNVDITGNFDAKTLDGVKAFQTKYLAETMAPWGVTTPTGSVYLTTEKKINEIACNTTLNFTAAQLAEIQSYKDGSVSVTNANTTTGSINSTNSIPLSPEVGLASTTDNTSQTAAVGNISFFGKVWSFIKHIFGR